MIIDLDISRCRNCGRLFAPEAGRDRCSLCDPRPEPVEPAPPDPEGDAIRALQEEASPEALEQALELLKTRIIRVLDGGEGVESARCARCGQREPLVERDLCLRCTIDLQHAFGEAADLLFTQISAPPPPLPSARTTLAAKRRRSYAAREGLIGAQRWR